MIGVGNGSLKQARRQVVPIRLPFSVNGIPMVAASANSLLSIASRRELVTRLRFAVGSQPHAAENETDRAVDCTVFQRQCHVCAAVQLTPAHTRNTVHLIGGAP